MAEDFLGPPVKRLGFRVPDFFSAIYFSGGTLPTQKGDLVMNAGARKDLLISQQNLQGLGEKTVC